MSVCEMTVDDALHLMRRKLAGIVPDIELKYKAELVCEINQLKEERHAVILGHNYMEPALYHTVPDFVGDSLELSRRAADADAEIIVFCGVRFMAETAKIISPDKTVLLPSLEAGCSLAASITAQDVRALRRRFPGVPVVGYVNTYAEVKAECDACCTSSNAAEVVESMAAPVVIFIPDEYLARNTARQTGRDVVFPDQWPPEYRLETGATGHRLETGATHISDMPFDRPTLIAWRGRCEVHEKFTVQDVRDVRAQVQDVMVLAHPECSPEVVAASDFSGSTSAMSRFVRQSPARRFLLLTECAMGDNVAADNPEKEMVRLCSVRCPHMNQITLEQTRDALFHVKHEITVPEAVAARARGAIERMLAAPRR